MNWYWAAAVLISGIETYFPHGIQRYLVGGLFIGFGVVLIYATTSHAPGASSFLESTLSYLTTNAYFQQSSFLETRQWRFAFTLGIVSGAITYLVFFMDGIWTTDVQLWRLFLGGILVGIGTRLGKGCTSGHGICGIGSRSPTSIINVALFLFIATCFAQLVFAMGIRP
jgi:uncharacterized membrane protein YedE/YeeE